MIRIIRLAFVTMFCALFAGAASTAALGQNVLQAQFTPTPIVVDGSAEAAWKNAPAQNIAICMNPALTSQLSNCAVTATVQALWNGPLLYYLVTVTDPDITTTSTTTTNQSSVQIYVDHYNDKFPKFEEDDGLININAAGVQTGNTTNAGLLYYPTVWQTHLQSSAAALRYDSTGKKIGYTVEVGWYIGDRPVVNNTIFGAEFVVYAAASATNTNQYQLYWNSGQNQGTNSNTMWGDVELAGYDGVTPMQLNKYMLQVNIKKATPATVSYSGLVQGIWTDLTAVNSALANANAANTSATTQAQIDTANAALDTALRGLRRSGKYPDPQDLPSLTTLPDPFTFYSGTKVKSLADWTTRRAELKDLMQYYEFGYMPAAPQSLKAVSTPASSGTLNYKTIAVTIQDNGKTASFTPLLYLPTTGTPPYPVIVEEDIFASPAFSPPNPAFINGGYAVLSIPVADYTAFGLPGIASDDGNHTGTFFNLYPYQLDTAGDDHGVLLAWAWGASRGVDALQYLSANDPNYSGLLNLNKLVVTGYSRYGKATLFAGAMDPRFQVTAPGGAGSGGPTPYRYDSFGNTPFRSAPFGNVYPWGVSPGAEVMGDHVRHQTHNSNEMIRRFLNDIVPAAVQQRMYQTNSWGYGTRMPYDHHEEVALIAPRAVIIDATNNDYADNAEGDSIGYEGAKSVYQFLGASQNLALDLDLGNTGHGLTTAQAQNIVIYSNFVLNGTPMPPAVSTLLTTDPYVAAGTYNTYYGGLSTMMPWLTSVPHANLLTSLSISTGTLSPAFAQSTGSYAVSVPYGSNSLTLNATSEDPKAIIAINGGTAAAGTISQKVTLVPGINTENVAVTSQDGVVNSYQVAITEAGAATTATLTSSTPNSNQGASVTFTATIAATAGTTAPTGSVNFLDGNTSLGSSNLTATGATTSTATYSTATLMAGTHSITAVYVPPANYTASASSPLSQIVTAPSLTSAFSSTSLSIASGSTGTSTLTVTPVGGFTGVVSMACGTLPLADLSCTFSPASLTFTGTNAAQSSTLTIGTKAMAALTLPSRPGSTGTSTGTYAVLAFPLLGMLTLLRRRKAARGNWSTFAAIALFTVTALFGITACSGGGSNNAPVGSYTVPVTVTANGQATTLNVTVVIH